MAKRFVKQYFNLEFYFSLYTATETDFQRPSQFFWIYLCLGTIIILVLCCELLTIFLPKSNKNWIYICKNWKQKTYLQTSNIARLYQLLSNTTVIFIHLLRTFIINVIFLMWFLCEHWALTLSLTGSSAVTAWILYARKQRMAPIHSRIEKPPNSCLQNFTHSGVVGGGVSAFGPSRARISIALLWVKPWEEWQELH